jgi:ABC-type transporter lipoprotein component MlaA
LDALREGSLDFYAQMRSVYRQYRAKQLGNQSTEGLPNFDEY